MNKIVNKKNSKVLNMVQLEFIGVGVLLVIMGTLFSLLGTVGSIIGFIIAIAVVACVIHAVKEKKVSTA